MFDHGNSLFNFAAGGDLLDSESLAAYADSLVPAVYDDFIGTAKRVLSKQQRNALCGLLNFRFKRHSRYNLPDQRMKDASVIKVFSHGKERKLVINTYMLTLPRSADTIG